MLSIVCGMFIFRKNPVSTELNQHDGEDGGSIHRCDNICTLELFGKVEVKLSTMFCFQLFD